MDPEAAYAAAADLSRLGGWTGDAFEAVDAVASKVTKLYLGRLVKK